MSSLNPGDKSTGNKVLIIHHQTKQADKIESALLEAGGSQVRVVAFDGAEKELVKKNIEYKTPTAYLGKKGDDRFESEAMMLVKSLGTQKFDGDKSLVKLLEYDNTSLYWLVEIGLYFSMRQLIGYVEDLIPIVEKERPTRMVTMDDDSLLTKVTIAVARAKGISVQLLPLGWPQRAKVGALSAIRRIVLPVSESYLREARDFLRRRLRPSPVRGSTTRGKEEGCRKIFFTPSGREKEVTSPVSGKKVREDAVLGPVIRQLESDSDNRIVFQYRPSSPFQLRLPEEMRGNKKVNYALSECYLTPRIRKTISRQRRLLRSRWKELASNEKFRALLTYRDISLWDVCRDELKEMFYRWLPAVVKDIELSRRMMEIERPDIVVTANENIPDNRSIIVASNSKNIPVLATQHGAMAANALWITAYRCRTDELSSRPSRSSIFPARLAIYGEDSRSILKEIGYPFEERIVITGRPGYDILVKAGEIFSRERFCTNWNIDPARKVVLVISQILRTPGLKERFFTSIFRALKDTHQIQIAIKPHPQEPEEWYKRLAEELGVKAVVLPRNADTFEALYACDVLLTFYSTAALEAMILEKPVVTLNLTSQPDLVPYASSGAAFGVYKAEDIAPAVKQVLEDPETRKRLELGRQEYLYEQFYKLDGQATERVVDLIYSMTRQKAPAK